MITNAILRAYQTMRARNWDTVYWAIDLHGVCFPSNYQQGDYTFINETCKEALRAISARPESRIILWSSCHAVEQKAIMEFFGLHGIKVHYFNQNPEVEDTKTGCFAKKFYFSVLLDDKAGFDPEQDWEEVLRLMERVL